MEQGSPQTSNVLRFRTIVTLADQVAKALDFGQEPAVLTPQFTLAYRLARLAIDTHVASRPDLSAIAEALIKGPGRTVAKLAFHAQGVLKRNHHLCGYPVQSPGRHPYEMARDYEDYFIVVAALDLSPTTARQRVCEHAVMLDSYGIAMREIERRFRSLGDTEKKSALAVYLLASDTQPEFHGEAWDTLLSLDGLPSLARRVPQIERGASTKKTADRDAATSALTHAVSELLLKLREEEKPDLAGAMLDGEKRITHLPHAAQSDVRNLWERGQIESGDDFRRRLQDIFCPACHLPLHGAQVCPACHIGIGNERGSVPREVSIPDGALEEGGTHEVLKETIAQVLIPGGASSLVWTSEKAAAAMGRQDCLSDFLSDPPEKFLGSLTALERKALDGLRRLWDTQQFDLERRDLLTEIAEAADVSCPTVSRLFKKIRGSLLALD